MEMNEASSMPDAFQWLSNLPFGPMIHRDTLLCVEGLAGSLGFPVADMQSTIVGNLLGMLKKITHCVRHVAMSRSKRPGAGCPWT